MKSMKWWLLACALLCTTALTAYAQPDEYQNAVYIYMCGSTLETRRGCATDNIAEILAADLPEDTCIVIQTGGARRWRDYGISGNHLTRFVITSDGMQEVERLESASMGNKDTLADFLLFCAEGYPAAYTGLIFWDHGGGSVNGVCFDENHGMDALTIPEFSDALGIATGNGQRKYDFIGFDACLMATCETAKAIQPYADAMIASQELEPLGGWDYRTLVERLGEDTFLQDVLDSYARKCREKGVNVYTLSCIDLTQFDRLEAAFRDFCLRLCQTDPGELQTIVAAVSGAASFGYSSESEGYSNLFDLSMFAENLGHAALSEAIRGSTSCVNSPTKEGSGGISVFYPVEDVRQVDRYVMHGIHEQYNRFLTEHYSDIPTSGLIAFEDPGSERDDEMFVSVTKASIRYVKKVEYQLFQIINLNDEQQMALCLGTDTDIDTAGNAYTTSFGGKWVVWNDRFIHVSAIERIGDITTFSTPVIVNGERGSVRFAYDIGQRTYAIQGFLSEANDGATSRLHELQEGDEVTLVYQEITPEYEQVWCVGDTFTYGSGSILATREVPDGRYLISLRLWDIFGNLYRSNTELLEYQDGQTDCLEILDDIVNLNFRPAAERL